MGFEDKMKFGRGMKLGTRWDLGTGGDLGTGMGFGDKTRLRTGDLETGFGIWEQDGMWGQDEIWGWDLGFRARIFDLGTGFGIIPGQIFRAAPATF